MQTVKQDVLLGTVKRCPRCREWWPMHDGFFQPVRSSSRPQRKFHSYCRACFSEWTRERMKKRGKVCPKCHKRFPLTEKNFRAIYVDGMFARWFSYCRPCEKQKEKSRKRKAVA